MKKAAKMLCVARVVLQSVLLLARITNPRQHKKIVILFVFSNIRCIFVAISI